MSLPLSARTRVAVTSFALLCVSLVLTAYSAKNPGFARAGSTVVGEVVAPMQQLSSGTHSVLAGLIDNYVALVGVRDENKLLAIRLRAVEEENARLREAGFENERLRSLLGMSNVIARQGVAASVIGYDPSGWVKGIVIDKGTRHGVTDGMPVVVGVGVVGQVVAAGRTSSRVLLITDHASGVDALIQESRIRGVVEGSGGSICRLHYIRNEEPVKRGDRIITSGMDGVYPKGLLLGHVAEVARPTGTLFQSITLRPAVDFERLEEVFVVSEPVVRDEKPEVKDRPAEPETKASMRRKE